MPLFSEIVAGVRQDMSERSGGEIFDERSHLSEMSERSGKSERSQTSERSQRSGRSQLSEAYEKLETFACNVNSESKSKVDMHPLREVRKLANLRREEEFLGRTKQNNKFLVNKLMDHYLLHPTNLTFISA